MKTLVALIIGIGLGASFALAYLVYSGTSPRQALGISGAPISVQLYMDEVYDLYAVAADKIELVSHQPVLKPENLDEISSAVQKLDDKVRETPAPHHMQGFRMRLMLMTIDCQNHLGRLSRLDEDSADGLAALGGVYGILFDSYLKCRNSYESVAVWLGDYAADREMFVYGFSQ